MRKRFLLQMVWWINKHKHYITYVSNFMLYLICMLSGHFYGTEIWQGIFWRFNFGPQFFGGFVWSPRDFFWCFCLLLWGFFFFFFFFLGGGVDFRPHSIIPVTWDPEYPPPTPMGKDWLRLKLENAMREKNYQKKKLWLLLHNSRGAFLVWVKAPCTISHAFSTELT